MAIPSRQIGWGGKENLLWQISKQLEYLICVRSGGCGSTTTTTTAAPITTTTTTLPPIECIVFIASNGNIYIYDPLTNLSVEILSGSYFGVANTDTKLWTATGSRYIQEFDLTFAPGPAATYNRSIDIGTSGQYGLFAIDDVTLIVGSVNVSPQLSIYELDITTTIATRTYKGDVEAGYFVLDFILTTSGKLILTGIANDLSASKVWQYDYATWTLETSIDTTGQFTNGEEYASGIAEYNGNIYLFTRINTCSTSSLSGVYLLNVLTNSLVYTGQTTGFGCNTGASSWLPCNTTSLDPCLSCFLSDVTIGTQTWTACNLNVNRYQIGTPTLSTCGTSCGTTLTDNVLEFVYAAPDGGSGLIQVDSTNSYTQITITGNGGANGSTVSLCLDAVIPPLDCTSCNVVALPITGNGSVTSGTLTINTTYSGPSLLTLADSISTCAGLNTPTNCLILGSNVGAFTYTLTFSQPVNNVKFLFGGGGFAPGSTDTEIFTFTTNDGDLIPQVQDPVEWENLTTGAWCYYNDDPENGCIYGKLYNWYAINDSRGLAPAGYHIPSEAEVLTLQSYLGGGSVAGGAMKEIGTTHWNSPNTGATNSSGWTGLGGGVINAGGTWAGLGEFSAWWTTTPSIAGESFFYQLLYDNAGLFIQSYLKESGYYVRLIKDVVITTTTTSTTLGPTGFNTIYTHFEAL